MTRTPRTAERRLAVLGSPIAHSRSPQLHLAAYRVLGLDWDYTRAEVGDGELGGFLDGLGAEWRGLSLTMPLKRRVFELVDDVDPIARATRQGNTILLDRGRPVRAFNTDVHGVVQAFGDAGVTSAAHGVVIGGGATAESAAVALASLGAYVTVAVRDPEKVRASGAFAGASVVALADAGDAVTAADAVVSTVPPAAEFRLPLPDATTGVLLDVAYSPWPTPLAIAWAGRGGAVVHGLEMLLHQAVHQVRIFVAGTADEALPDEPEVIRAMRAAVE